jgi:acyl-CoA dehydrogenase
MDGPTEAHQGIIAREVLKDVKRSDGPWPTEFAPTRAAEARARLGAG